MPHLRTAFLTALGIGLMTLAVAGIADRDAEARLDRALRPEPAVRTASTVTALPFAGPASGR